MKDIFNECVDELVTEFINSNMNNLENYKFWLSQTYYQTKWSNQALRFIAQNSNNIDSKNRWLEHAKEEAGHHLDAKRDLQKLGGNLNQYEELHETKAIYQRQWFIAKHVSPEACYGWILALEGLAAKIPREYINGLILEHGEESMSFVIEHTTEDIEHLEKALQMVSSFKDQSTIIENLKTSTYFYKSMLSTINENICKLKLVG
jgi:pyrroloquinoline quinone (PQQ) biosynthesis protein C